MRRNQFALRPEHAQSPDYPTLRKQLNDYTSTFYGPHCCEGCGRHDIVRKAFEQGAQSWEVRECKGGTEYVPHHCSHVLLFRRLAGRVLTIVDAAFSPQSPQLKAIKDLLKRDFASTIADARELEGDRSAESTSSLEQIANDGGLTISA
jgi:ribosomal protein L37AE/L43A